MKLLITYILIFITAYPAAQSVEDELVLNRVDFSLNNTVLPVLNDTLVKDELKIYRDGEFRASFNAASGAYLKEADKRNKKDIRALKESTLQKVLQLEPVSYLMKNQRNRGRSIGLIAQDVKKIYPALVKNIDGEDILAISYTDLIPILIKAVQEQQNTIENLKNNQYAMQKEFAVFRLQMGQIAESTAAAETTFRNGVAIVAQNQN